MNIEYCQLLIDRVISFKNILSNEFQWLRYLLFWEALSELTIAGVADSGNVTVQKTLLQFSRVNIFSKTYSLFSLVPSHVLCVLSSVCVCAERRLLNSVCVCAELCVCACAERCLLNSVCLCVCAGCTDAALWLLCCSRSATARRGGGDDAAQRARRRRAAEPVTAAEETRQVLL